MSAFPPAISAKEFRISDAYRTRINQGRWMDERSWAETFRPITNPRNGEGFFDHAHPDDAAFLRAVGESHIWTDFDINLDGSNIEFVIMPGRYDVDREGHLVTQVPWTIHQSDLVIPMTYPGS